MEKHFVTFFSPGSFVAETTERAIESWDVAAAMDMADEIHERHGATPYGFRFSTRSRAPEDLDSKVTARSVTYYLGGQVETLEDVERRNDPKEEILRSNMRCNGWGRIIVNDNSWRWARPLNETDIVLDYSPKHPAPNPAEGDGT